MLIPVVCLFDEYLLSTSFVPDSVMKITAVNNADVIIASMKLIVQWTLLSVADQVSRRLRKVSARAKCSVHTNHLKNL